MKYFGCPNQITGYATYKSTTAQYQSTDSSDLGFILIGTQCFLRHATYFKPYLVSAWVISNLQNQG